MSRLSSYHIMVVSQYFKSFSDFICIQLIVKKYSNLLEMFHFNPIPLTTKTILYFPNIETLHVYSQFDEIFGNTLAQYTTPSSIPKTSVIKREFFEVVLHYEISFQVFLNFQHSQSSKNQRGNTTLQFTFKNVNFSREDFLNFKALILPVLMKNTLLCEFKEDKILVKMHEIINEKMKVNETKKLQLEKLTGDFSMIKSFGNKCFQYEETLTSFTPPKGVTSLGKYCLYNCYNLIAVSLPETLRNIDEKCFKNCTALRHINIPFNLKILRKSVFASCCSLSGVSLSNNVKEIGQRCFEKCTSISHFDFPNNLTSLGRMSFNSCCNLQFVSLGYSIESVGEKCFIDCAGLSEVQIGNKVKNIGNECFSGCFKLKRVMFETKVLDKISESCFAFCSNIVEIEIPKSVTKLERKCFYDCESLSKIKLPNTLTNFGENCFEMCSSLTFDGLTHLIQ
ncbi:hypothetical protein EIN_412180 [Entamoeba invadens IP1]|uniref:Leucine rich repeat containing protein BspA family protein n=1 Tax=Entamoeba invadens IP1 TaxID=370355 RepID=A0A0A1UFD4_ENTIV|nr:hypothetical protein EIN_412180 [Entamoeba invadens IP1]ELP95359.1 hypothetical protein EIN_412180 [Entamoeba invadens IP1]|eukprot:XP_004262130.1 hypothetical protein EIN_412180 [Entamoeba invadens IP1]